MKEKKVIVSLKGISKTYDNDVKVVKNIDLDIYEGEFLTILGASGCGKTTTLRMIAGFEDVSSGDICIDGSSVIGVPPYKRQVNTAFQSYALFPHLSVYDNIAYGLKVKKISKAEIHERVSHMLSLIRLDGYEKRKPAQLSGGQKQRVSIARALINFIHWDTAKHRGVNIPSLRTFRRVNISWNIEIVVILSYLITRNDL